MAQWFGGWPARLGASHIHTSTPLAFQLVNSVEVSNDNRDGRGINLPPMQTGRRRRQTKLFWELLETFFLNAATNKHLTQIVWVFVRFETFLIRARSIVNSPRFTPFMENFN